MLTRQRSYAVLLNHEDDVRMRFASNTCSFSSNPRPRTAPNRTGWPQQLGYCLGARRFVKSNSGGKYCSHAGAKLHIVRGAGVIKAAPTQARGGPVGGDGRGVGGEGEPRRCGGDTDDFVSMPTSRLRWRFYAVYSRQRHWCGRKGFAMERTEEPGVDRSRGRGDVS